MARRLATTKRTSLVAQTTAKLRDWMAQSELKPGDRLPTEAALCQTYGVSRTVIREAIAALRADGVVEARQGSGVFVVDLEARPFGLSLLGVAPGQLSAIIESLELRAAVESEAAALAAERWSPGELAKIQEQYDAISQAVASGAGAEDQDFAFHLAIANATHNRHFVEFFRFLGQRTIPRRQLQATDGPKIGDADYLARIQGEHLEILNAIAERDAAGAHRAMRAHLRRSQARYQRLATGRGLSAPGGSALRG